MQLTRVLFLQYKNYFVLLIRLLFPSFKLTLLYTRASNNIVQSHFCKSNGFLLGFRKPFQKFGQEQKCASLYLLPVPVNTRIAIALYLGGSVTSRFQDFPHHPTHTHISRLSLFSSLKYTNTCWMAVPLNLILSSMESLLGASNAQEPATKYLPLRSSSFQGSSQWL